jgi:uncharacterized protein (TIGR02118 family)
MIKLVAILKRKPGMTLEEFSAYYFEKHAPLARRVIPPEVAAGIRHYVQNHALRLGRGTSEPPCDCVTEIGFDDLAALQRWSAWYGGPDGKVLRDDEENFMDLGARVVVVTEVRVPPRDGGE